MRGAEGVRAVVEVQPLGSLFPLYQPCIGIGIGIPTPICGLDAKPDDWSR